MPGHLLCLWVSGLSEHKVRRLCIKMMEPCCGFDTECDSYFEMGKCFVPLGGGMHGG